MPAYVPTERIDTLAGRILATGASPGLVLALTDRDRLLDVRCYGHANPAAEEPVTRETLFPIGSISKSFTALCLLQLAERGELDLQRPVNELLPWFPVPEITVHHLLTHTGGIVMGLDELPCSPAGVLDLARVPAMPPGEHFWYSNAGYQALGYILERLTGERFWETYRRAIFEPLSMNATSGVISNELYPRLAVGHRPLHDDRPWRHCDPLVVSPWYEYANADGSICCPAAELAAYLRMLLNRGAGLIGADWFARWTERYTDNGEGDMYGYGLDVRDAGGHTWVGHSGGMVGHQALMWGDLDGGLGAVAFSNGTYGHRQLAEHALRLLLDPDSPDPLLDDMADTADLSTHDAEPPAEWAPRCGVYRSHNPWLSVIRVATRDGRPMAVFEGEELPLEPASDDSYRVGKEPWSPERLRFDTMLEGRTQLAWFNLAPYARSWDADT